MSAYAGTALLTRTALRRDRVIIPVWVAVLTLMVYASAVGTESIYSSEAERVHTAEGLNASGATVALYGPILDVHSLGELAMTKMTVLYAIFVAVLLVVLVRRHTRVEEESGRLELVGGTAVGAEAPTASALVEATGVSLLVGVLAALASIGGGLPATGSIVFGATWTGIGLVATGITAVTSQLSASARTCASLTAGAIGVLYILRAIGDTSVSWLSWLTPFGWNTQIRAWSEPRWWMLLLYVGLAVVLVGVARVLHGRRDLGSGMIAARPGPAVGSPRLADALALCVRLNSSALITWSIAIAAMGAVFGAIVPGFGDLLDSDSAQEMLQRLGGEGAMADTMVAAVLSIVAIVITFFAISVISHAGSDESDGRAETVLATATSRSRWYWSAVLVAFAGALWLLFLAGLFMWIGFGAAGSADGSHPDQIVPAALAWTPAVWLTSALAAGLLALRRSSLGYALPALCLVITLVGELLEAPGWFLGISPYSHVPQMPNESFAWAPELTLTALTAAVLLGAWGWFRTRDIG
ncbi:ABC transporter permease [Nocardioides luteus]